jgi:hypothetical protein
MISDNTLYPLVEVEVKKVPHQAGVYMLWRGPNILMEVAETDSLLYALLQAHEKLLEATHFSINTAYGDHAGRQQFVERTCEQWIGRRLPNTDDDVA